MVLWIMKKEYVKLSAMIRKITSLSRKTSMVLLVIIVAVGAGLYLNDHKKKTVDVNGLPEYINFSSNYVFAIPKNYTVDSQSTLGAELIYSAPLSAKTVEDVYSQNGIAVQGLNIADHSGKAFKDYVNNTFVPDLKKNLSANDVKVQFGKAGGSDNAQVTVRKDGQPQRFIYLKNGQHPASVIAKRETDSFKAIEQTINDLENSDLKNESDGIKQSIQNNVQLAKAQKAQELYNGAAPELRTQSTQAQLTTALGSATPYLSQNIAISGGSYAQGSFSAALRFTPLNQDNPEPALGSITLKKTDGQWKLRALSLPIPKPQ